MPKHDQYSREELIQAIQAKRPYQQECVNYNGTYQRVPYIEILSDYILNNDLNLKPYQVREEFVLHDKKDAPMPNASSEKGLCRYWFFLEKFDSENLIRLFGKPIDYELNIYGKRVNIDLITYNDRTDEVFFLEVKGRVPKDKKRYESPETLLRCALEIKTYFDSFKTENFETLRRQLRTAGKIPHQSNPNFRMGIVVPERNKAAKQLLNPLFEATNKLLSFWGIEAETYPNHLRIDFTDKGLLKNLKGIYDEALKEAYLTHGSGFGDDDFPWSPEYPLYFKNKILTNLMKNMRPEVVKAYQNAPGHELEERGAIPPKFLSIASSSRFCYESLEINEFINEHEGADFFSRPGDHLETVEFEKELRVDSVQGTPPSMDAYARGSQREYFFECKCHEMFDDHPLFLSKQYFGTGKDLIVDHIPAEFLSEKDDGYSIDPKAFGEADTLFDIKQLLTHLMGIVCNRTAPECDLIYYYALPEKTDVKDERLVGVIEKTKADAIRTFESSVIKEYCKAHHITLRLCVKNAASPYAASKRNTIECY